MLQMPRRSVTRFFIPLIDVLTLLFCIFLMMPAVKKISDVETAEAGARERLAEREKDLERQEKTVAAEKLQLRDQLDALRRETTNQVKKILAPRVLEIDPSNGRLFYRNSRGDREEIKNETDAQRLIQEEQGKPGGPDAAYFVIQYPPDPSSDLPTSEQGNNYRNWFAGVSVAFEKNGKKLNVPEKRGPP